MIGIRVVFVTDREQLAQRVTQALAATEVKVSWQATLLGLYPILVRDEPDVVLLDGSLPRLALESTARFLHQKGQGRRFPIVMLTSTTDDAPDPAGLAVSCQADDFIDETAEPALLFRAIRRVALRARGADSDSGRNRLPGAPLGDRKGEVLVVDDDDSIAHILKRILESRYAVSTANGGALALQLCGAYNFDAIFCDLQMPGVSGADVYRTLAATKPALAARVVFVTAHALDPEQIELFMGLPNHIVHKPFMMREILAVAAKVIGG